MTNEYNVFEVIQKLKNKASERNVNLTDVNVLAENWGWFTFKLNGYTIDVDNFVDFFNKSTGETKKLIPANGVVNEILYFCYA